MSIRRLLPSEAAKLGGHLARLSSEERTLRFMGAMSDEAVRDHCERIDWFRTVVIGFFDAGVLRGAAELWVDYRHFPLAARRPSPSRRHGKRKVSPRNCCVDHW